MRGRPAAGRPAELDTGLAVAESALALVGRSAAVRSPTWRRRRGSGIAGADPRDVPFRAQLSVEAGRDQLHGIPPARFAHPATGSPEVQRTARCLYNLVISPLEARRRLVEFFEAVRNLASASALPGKSGMATSVWRGRIAFGMVSIPVRLYKAARRERMRFHQVYRPAEVGSRREPEIEEPDETDPVSAPQPVAAPPSARAKEIRATEAAQVPFPAPSEAVARVRHIPVAQNTEEPLETPRVLKGYEIEKDRYVTFEPHEVAALRPRTSSELTVAEFVRLAEIDPVFFETSYYAAADAGGEKAYALFFRALSETGYAAVGSLAMHGREHATVIRPGRRGLILHTLFYEKEVRAQEEYRIDAGLVSEKELELAKMFVQALAAPFDPGKLKDTFEERLREFVQQRADAAVPAHPAGESTRRAPVVDIMEALRKSLEMARKPPKPERPQETTPARNAKPRQRRSRA